MINEVKTKEDDLIKLENIKQINLITYERNGVHYVTNAFGYDVPIHELTSNIKKIKIEPLSMSS